MAVYTAKNSHLDGQPMTYECWRCDFAMQEPVDEVQMSNVDAWTPTVTVQVKISSDGITEDSFSCREIFWTEMAATRPTRPCLVEGDDSIGRTPPRPVFVMAITWKLETSLCLRQFELRVSSTTMLKVPNIVFGGNRRSARHLPLHAGATMY